MLNLFIGRAKGILEGEQSISCVLCQKLYEDQRPNIDQNETINKKWAPVAAPLLGGQNQRNLHGMNSF